MTTKLSKADERFHNDAQWHALVCMLEKQILELELSPSEIREAAMYAAYRVEMRRPVQIESIEVNATFTRESKP